MPSVNQNLLGTRSTIEPGHIQLVSQPTPSGTLKLAMVDASYTGANLTRAKVLAKAAWANVGNWIPAREADAAAQGGNPATAGIGSGLFFYAECSDGVVHGHIRRSGDSNFQITSMSSNAFEAAA